MDGCLSDTKELLEETYKSLNIIFPKYRNLVAVSTFYEYFASGRVNELEGPNGAYNLYENELRQNLIINNLNTISNNLEDIKNNQYILYSEIKDTNLIMQNVENEISSILKNSELITESSYITSYCAKITAQNTQLMATMQFLK